MVDKGLWNASDFILEKMNKINRENNNLLSVPWYHWIFRGGKINKQIAANYIRMKTLKKVHDYIYNQIEDQINEMKLKGVNV